MFARIYVVLACAVMAMVLMQSGFARGKGASRTTTITGCLAQGDHANEYAIKAEDGKTYGLHSSGVNLAEHMGHKVEVTGTVTNAKEKAGTEASTGKPEEQAHMKVTNLKMVSTTCP